MLIEWSRRRVKLTIDQIYIAGKDTHIIGKSINSAIDKINLAGQDPKVNIIVGIFSYTHNI